jgi:hypothetical protein
MTAIKQNASAAGKKERQGMITLPSVLQYEKQSFLPSVQWTILHHFVYFLSC